MAHRLFHSLVISSVFVLEGLGCAVSHDPGPDGDPPQPPEPDAGPGFEPDAAVDSGRRSDAAADTGTPDTGAPDTGAPDSGTPDTGAPDSGVPDTGVPDAGDPRFCEPGWPTTKASFCVTINEGDGWRQVECCNSFGAEDGGGPVCCIGEESW